MSRIDYANQLIECKVVYFGPMSSGKTANLHYIWQKTKSPDATWMRLDAPNQANAQYYDYLPISLGEIRGFKTRLHLFTVPGAPNYAAARRQLLEAVDGLVFVADSRRERARDNAAALSELGEGLASWGFALAALPLVVQCNFADVPGAASAAAVAAPLIGWHPNAAGVPVFASAATSGTGVFDTLKAISKLILSELRKAG